MKRRTFLTSPLAFAVLQSVPLQAFAQQSTKPFRFVPSSDLTAIDPVFSTAGVAQTHGQLIYDTLYGLDDAFEPHPQMAAGHQVSEDGLVWTITLRDGLKFHDGAPVTATDALASLERWMSRDGLGSNLKIAMSGMSAPDAQTLVITLTQKFPLLLNALAKPIANMAAIMPERIAKTKSGESVKESIGSGPYRFVADKWISGASALYTRFEDYVPTTDATPPSFTAGAKTAYIPEVRWTTIADKATAVAALLNDEVDAVEALDLDFITMFEGNPDVTLVRRSLPNIGIIRFNHLHAPFNNKAIRQAVQSAVNQTDYMVAMNGNTYPEYWSDKCGVFAPGSPMDTQVGMEVLTGPRDIDAAKAAIIAAGYANEPVVILDPVDLPSQHATALVTADLFQKLGFNVVVESIDWGTNVQRRNSKALPSEGGWSVAFTLMGGFNNLDPSLHLGIRGNGEAAWFGWPTSPELEWLNTAWYKTETLEERKKLCEEIQLQVFEDVPYIPVGAIYSVTALRSNWEGFSGQLSLFFNLKEKA